MQNKLDVFRPLVPVNDTRTENLDGGEVASVQLIELTDGEKYIVKKDPHAGRLHAEVRGLHITEALGIPAPQLVTARFTESEIVMTYLDGHLASEERSPEFYSALMQIVSNLHATHIEGSPFGHFNGDFTHPTWEGYLQERLKRNIIETRKNVEIPDDIIELIGVAHVHLLSRLPARDIEPRLLHGDIHFENVMVLKEGGLALFDFCELAVGDPLYDLAILCNFEPWSEDGLRDAYPNREIFEQGGDQWFAYYSFLHAIEIYLIYSWKDPSKKQRYWDRAMSFVE